MAAERDALITGIGLVSCLGEGVEAHWAALNQPGGFAPVVDAASFAPWPVHPMVPLELDTQIPKRGDQRQMEAWQRIGTYAAGLALDSAGLKGNAEVLGRTDMIVAAGGGERDYAVDEAILSALPASDNPDVLLNQRLMSDLRPTLFLAQLSNLLAGNISIVHGVIGSSRTFMGEEAVRHRRRAHRLRAHRGGAGRRVPGRRLVQRPAPGHPDAARAGRHAVEAATTPRSGRASRPAAAWCWAPWAASWCWKAARTRRRAARRRWPTSRPSPPTAAAAARARPPRWRARQLAGMRQHLQDGAAAVISGASGAAAATGEEAAFLAELGLPVRAAATRVRAFAGTVLPGQPGAGGDVGAAGRAVPPAGSRRGADVRPVAPGPGHLLGHVARRGHGRGGQGLETGEPTASSGSPP